MNRRQQTWLPAAALLTLAGVAGAQSPDVQALYVKQETWQRTWLAATEALAELEAREAAERASVQAPEGISLAPWHMIGSFSNADHKQFDTAFMGLLSDHVVEFSALLAEFEHVPKDRDPAPRTGVAPVTQ